MSNVLVRCSVAELSTALYRAPAPNIKNWINSCFLNSKVQQSSQGSTRWLNVQNIYEIVLLYEITSCGTPFITAKIWNRAILAEINEHGYTDIHPSYWANGPKAILFSAELDEMAIVDDEVDIHHCRDLIRELAIRNKKKNVPNHFGISVVPVAPLLAEIIDRLTAGG